MSLYVIQHIGALPGDKFSQPKAMNEKGRVVGFSSPGELAPRHAFSWKNGVFTNLHTLLQATLGAQDSEAEAINVYGDVVGGWFPDPGPVHQGPSHGFLYKGGNIFDLQPLTEKDNSWAKGISDSRRVVGSSFTNWSPVYWDDPTMGPIEMGHETPTILGGYAWGTNQAGTIVVGGLEHVDGVDYYGAFVWDQNQPNVRVDLNPQLDNSGAFAINGAGHAAGKAGGKAAFWVKTQKYAPLDPLPGDTNGEARALNSGGQVVGVSTQLGQSRAVLWDTSDIVLQNAANAAAQDLNTLVNPNSGWTFISADGINSTGAIVGRGSYTDPYDPATYFTNQGYLLTPLLPPHLVENPILVFGRSDAGLVRVPKGSGGDPPGGPFSGEIKNIIVSLLAADEVASLKRNASAALDIRREAIRCTIAEFENLINELRRSFG